MTKRKSIPKALRFEVFKRDSFKCQYCGKSSPDVLLHIDHITPLCLDGTALDIGNLLTACADCNLGKGTRPLSQNAALSKQRKQLEEIQTRREQLEMMAQWQSSMIDLDAEAVQAACQCFTRVCVGYSINPQSYPHIRRTIKKFGLSDVMEAIRDIESYLKREPSGAFSIDSVNLAFNKIAPICAIRKRDRQDPVLGELHHILSVGGKLLEGDCVRWQYIADMKAAMAAGASIEDLWSWMRESYSFWSFRKLLREFLGEE